MSKKDAEVMEQLEQLLQELKEGKKQAAAAAAVDPLSYSAKKPARFSLKKGKWLGILLVVAILAGAAVGAGSYRFFTRSTEKAETGAFVEQINELSSLATAQAFVKGVIEKEDNEIFGKKINADLPGTKRKVLLIVPGTVTAGVDLEAVQKADLHVDEKKKKITISLPHAKLIQEPSIDFDNIRLYSVEGLFRSGLDAEEAYDLAGEAKELLKKEAGAMGLLETAENNAEKALKEFFAQMGYEAAVQFSE